LIEKASHLIYVDDVLLSSGNRCSKNGSSWKMINDTDIVDRDLEMMLSNAIDKHLHPYQA